MKMPGCRSPIASASKMPRLRSAASNPRFVSRFVDIPDPDFSGGRPIALRLINSPFRDPALLDVVRACDAFTT